MAELVDSLVANEAVAIDILEWSLTDTRLARERCAVRDRAVAIALEKVEVFASVIGFSDR